MHINSIDQFILNYAMIIVGILFGILYLSVIIYDIATKDSKVNWRLYYPFNKSIDGIRRNPISFLIYILVFTLKVGPITFYIIWTSIFNTLIRNELLQYLVSFVFIGGLYWIVNIWFIVNYSSDRSLLFILVLTASLLMSLYFYSVFKEAKAVNLLPMIVILIFIYLFRDQTTELFSEYYSTITGQANTPENLEILKNQYNAMIENISISLSIVWVSSQIYEENYENFRQIMIDHLFLSKKQRKKKKKAKQKARRDARRSFENNIPSRVKEATKKVQEAQKTVAEATKNIEAATKQVEVAIAETKKIEEEAKKDTLAKTSIKKPVAKKAAIKKPTVKKSTTAKKPVAKKAPVKKVVTKKK